MRSSAMNEGEDLLSEGEVAVDLLCGVLKGGVNVTQMTSIGAYGFLCLLIVKGSTFAMSGATVSTFLNLTIIVFEPLRDTYS